MHPTGGSLRVFKLFSWLEVGSGKVALSPPTHQRVTPAVGRLAQWLGSAREDAGRVVRRPTQVRAISGFRAYEWLKAVEVEWVRSATL